MKSYPSHQYIVILIIIRS